MPDSATRSAWLLSRNSSETSARYEAASATRYCASASWGAFCAAAESERGPDTEGSALEVSSQDQIGPVIAAQVRCGEGKSERQVGGWSRPEGAVAVAEQHLHGAAERLYHVGNSIAIGVGYSHPVEAEVRVVTPREKRWRGSGSDSGTCQARQKACRQNRVSSHSSS